MARKSKSPQPEPAVGQVPGLPVEFRLRIVKLTWKRVTPKLLIEHLASARHSVQRLGESLSASWSCRGWRLRCRPSRVSRVPEEVGSRRWRQGPSTPSTARGVITDVLKRFFLMRTSPSTVTRPFRTGAVK